MADSETIIIFSLCLVIMLLLHLLLNKKKVTEGFQITNDVPQKNKIEINYLKKLIKPKKYNFSVCPTSAKCGSNRFHKWCNNQKLKK